ncbi:hypothetical protein [Ketobacter sp.]|uniref:hypothetical protein n=1 Tax=Ketobacter sp. TaxID=2083498 RepID=UPI0025BA5CA7|nr:hypothetical protein [Ketobacter sp.]
MTNDPLGDLSMKPARDELAQRQSSRGKPAKTHSPKPSRPAAGAAPSSQAGLWSVLIVLIVFSAGGGWFLWDKIERLQSSLKASTANLATAEQALSQLQSNLENRDNTLSKSGDQMVADIKLLDSEVRKLWDLSNKKNRPEIEGLVKDVKALQGELKSSSSSIGSLSKKVSASEEQHAALKKQLGEIKESSATLAKTSETLKKDLQQMKSILGNAADFDDRITSLEVAIKAIDAHRSQLNGRLEKLDKEVGALMSGASGT